MFERDTMMSKKKLLKVHDKYKTRSKIMTPSWRADFQNSELPNFRSNYLLPDTRGFHITRLRATHKRSKFMEPRSPSTVAHATAKYRSSHRDNFRKYLFFSSRSTFFWNFPGGSMCSPNRY